MGAEGDIIKEVQQVESADAGKRGCADEKDQKREPPGSTGRLSNNVNFGSSYLLTIFSTISPMIGSLNISWL